MRHPTVPYRGTVRPPLSSSVRTPHPLYDHTAAARRAALPALDFTNVTLWMPGARDPPPT
eukprot:759490-Hanusia_phi.AAC.1